uniref:Candidate secreted effector n=1 Tax=Meloidogyne incognita TaxID=6306 RepID=A0A914NQ88_MELIC
MIEENKSKWSNFGNWTECTESCGGCGIRWRNRECLKKKDGCNCIGQNREEEVCNLNVCIYPKQPTCCGQRFPASVNGTFSCAISPNFDIVENETLKY